MGNARGKSGRTQRHLTRDGKDDVVIVATSISDKERRKLAGAALVKALAHPAVAGLEMERTHVTGSHRDIDV